MIHFQTHRRHHEMVIVIKDEDVALAEVTLPDDATFEDVVAELTNAVAARAMVRAFEEGE